MNANMFETKHYNDNEVAITRERMHFYLIGGHVFDLSPSVQFKPAFLSKIVSGAPLQVDVTANFLINEKFTVGLAYRWSAALSALVGFKVSDRISIGYGYDRETTRLSNFNSGSHEIFLQFDLFKISQQVETPRFF